MKNKVLEKICYHRGFGEENTLEALSNALKETPFMLEFDVQLYQDSLHLGHPPAINTEEALSEALLLYPSTVIPKIDLKSKGHIVRELNLLKKALLAFDRFAIVNLGDVRNQESLKAEAVFAQLEIPKAMLNIDLQRYDGLVQEEIEQHVNALKQRIFSVSPNLKKDFAPSVLLAKKFNIQHLHFWADENDIYKEPFLLHLVDTLSDQGFEVYFDIALKNVSFKSQVKS